MWLDWPDLVTGQDLSLSALWRSDTACLVVTCRGGGIVPVFDAKYILQAI